MTGILHASIPAHLSNEGPASHLVEISVLGTFGLRIDGVASGALSVGSQRLLAFLALHDRAVGRVAMAGTMWPDASDSKAGASLRSAVSRLEGATHDAVLVASAGLSLATTVVVDLRDSQALAQRLLLPGGSPDEADLAQSAVSALSMDVLPDWYDDWVVTEAEDWRQLRMNALEAQAGLLIAGGRMAGAAGAARAAMRVEPLRESAHASLVRVHMAEGNQSEALRVFDRYRILLLEELGLEPTSRISDLVAGIRNRRRGSGDKALDGALRNDQGLLLPHGVRGRRVGAETAARRAGSDRRRRRHGP